MFYCILGRNKLKDDTVERLYVCQVHPTSMHCSIKEIPFKNRWENNKKKT